MPSRPKFDPTRIPDEAWEYDGHSPDGLRRYWIAWVDREKGTFIRKTENLAEPELLEMNREDYNDSFGKRFGDGRVVARIPLNVFFRDWSKALKEGDTDFNRWWLNRSENRPYRTFRGNI